MKIDGKKITAYLTSLIKKEIKNLKKIKPLQLTTILVEEENNQISFVRIKAKVAKQLGVNFKLIHLKTTPSFETFIQIIKKGANDKNNTGIIIQQPLPTRLSTESIYDSLPLYKEIEGHKTKSPFLPPIGLAVLTIIKYIFNGCQLEKSLLLSSNLDYQFFKKTLRHKKVLLVGRGLTGGKPIGKTLSWAKINYLNIHSTTPQPENYYREADLIISAVGKEVIKPEFLKPNVILINVGLRKENNKLKGDYDENKIKKIASFYTPTPGGVGPLDVFYLYKNLTDAFKLQNIKH